MNKTISIFDFDDTLCVSEMSTVFVFHKDGSMTPVHGHNWSEYTEKPGDRFDFSDFDRLKNPCVNTPVWNEFLAAIATYGKEHVWICTARGFPEPLEYWFKEMGLTDIQIACMAIPPGTNNGIYKSGFITKRLSIAENQPYSHVKYYDDREDCVEAVADLRNTFPEVDFEVFQVAGEVLLSF